MNKYDIGLLMFRGLAIYSGIRALEYSQQLFDSMAYGVELKGLVFLLFVASISAPVFLLIVCSVLLWVFAPSLSKKVFASTSVVNESKIELTDIRSLVFSAIGLILLVQTVPDFLYRLLFFNSIETFDREILVQRNIHIVINIVEIVIGWFLFFGVKRIVRFVSMLRRD